MNIVVKQPSLAIMSKGVMSQTRFPIHRIYCIGRNYREHAIEMGHNPDREPPFFFQKAADTIVCTSSSSIAQVPVSL
jgi:fumarylpyruvate hydrolase